MRIPLSLTFLLTICTLLSGCGKGGPGRVSLKATGVSTDDVVKVLGIEVRKFRINAGKDVPVGVAFWVEEYLPSEDGPVTHKHELGRWGPEHLSGDLLLMFPTQSTRKCYFSVGSSAVTSELPASVDLGSGAGLSKRVPDEIEFQLGEDAILAVEIQSDETTGGSAAGMQEYVDENVRLGKYERILVFKARFTPRESADGTE